MKTHKRFFICFFFVGLLHGNYYVYPQINPLRINNVDYYEADYTIPSFTELRRRYTAANVSNPSSALINARQTAIDNLRAKEMPYNVVMNLYDDPTSKMAFNWITNAGITGGKVQIVQGKVSNESAFATPFVSVNATCTPLNNVNYNVSGNNLSSLAGIPDNTKKSYTENKALVTGLIPNTTYSFRVGKEGFWSEIGTFTTARNDKNAFSFIYVTDSQSETYSEFQTVQIVASAAFKTNPNAGFWLHCGDLCQTRTGATWEWEQLFEMQQVHFLKYPFAPIAGNHDNGASEPLFTKHFHTNNPDFERNGSNSARTPGSTYSYVYGDALFFAINSHEVSSYYNALATWMRTEVAKHSDIKWRIAYFHTAAYTGSNDYQASSEIRSWRDRISPVLDELGVDIALQGHAHVYEVIGPVKNKQLVGNTVTNQQTVPVHTTNNLTGKLGGTFNTTEGILYFLNSSMGPHKYIPKPLNQMDNEELTGITNYQNLFTGRFGQPGNPTFSNMTVSTDAIVIYTYEVLSDDTISLFDEIKVVKSFTRTTNAQMPNITAHPQSATYNQNATVATLSVTASVTDSGTLTYRWYSNTTNSNTNGTSITGATSRTYTPTTETVGTKYYYVEVTNTNNSVNGTKTATVSSNTASVTVAKVTNAEDHFFTNLKIYPNPFPGKVYLTGADDCSLQVINAAGIIVHTQLTITIDQSIHLEHLPEGVYFFLLEKEGKTKTLKVVKE